MMVTMDVSWGGMKRTHECECFDLEFKYWTFL